jgi:hypothetical protein
MSNSKQPQAVSLPGEPSPASCSSGRAIGLTPEKFSSSLESLLKETAETFTSQSKTALKQLQLFVDAIRPEIEMNLETALRLNEETHWVTLEVQSSRVIMASVRLLDRFSADQRRKIRDTAIAAVGLLVKLAVV